MRTRCNGGLSVGCVGALEARRQRGPDAHGARAKRQPSVTTSVYVEWGGARGKGLAGRLRRGHLVMLSDASLGTLSSPV